MTANRPHHEHDDDGEGEVLRRFLDRHDVGCPVCGHSVHRSPSRRCPECGARLHLAVAADGVRLRAWLAGTISVALAMGATLLVALLLGVLLAVGATSARRDAETALVCAGLGLPHLVIFLLMLRTRRRFWRAADTVQWTVTAMLGVLGLATLISLTAYVIH